MAIHRVLSWRDPTTHTRHPQVPGFADRYAERVSFRHPQNPRMVHPRIPGTLGSSGHGTQDPWDLVPWDHWDMAPQDPWDGVPWDPWD